MRCAVECVGRRGTCMRCAVECVGRRRGTCMRCAVECVEEERYEMCCGVWGGGEV